MPSIGHPDSPICAHLSAKQGNTVELGLIDIRSTSCNPIRERLLPNLVRSMRSATRPQEHYKIVAAGASSVGQSSIL
jgi:hypothetical protein